MLEVENRGTVANLELKDGFANGCLLSRRNKDRIEIEGLERGVNDKSRLLHVKTSNRIVQSD